MGVCVGGGDVNYLPIFVFGADLSAKSSGKTLLQLDACITQTNIWTHVCASTSHKVMYSFFS